jgi:UDP-3-O-[3-hydroxymyristoyl] N-acetylglucosamine deacetylase
MRVNRNNPQHGLYCCTALEGPFSLSVISSARRRHGLLDSALERQTTLAASVSCAGIGVHSGAAANVTLRPARADHGVLFVRRDVTDRPNAIAAHVANVTATTLGTTLTNEDGVSVATVEHLLAALRGLGVDNVIVEIDGPEAPILDGSSADWVELITCAGLRTLTAPRRRIVILKPIEVVSGTKRARLEPHESSVFDVTIDFAQASIGRQRMEFELTAETFANDIADARTFGFLHEVEAMQAAGLGRGGSLENAVVLDGETIMNPEGLRFADEFVRHKALDVVGDLALAGAPIQGRYVAEQPGHALNIALTRALMADRSSWKWGLSHDADQALELAAAGV